MHKYKVVILGDGGVGKSCLTMRFTENNFIAEYDPTIENLFQRTITLDDQTFKLEILDTAGQEEYSIMQNQYIMAGDGFMIVFSVANRRSFSEVKKFFESIIAVKEDLSYPMVLVGNKSDLKREVSDIEINELLTQYNVPYSLTSAKTMENVEKPFITLTRAMCGYRRTNQNQKMIKNRRCSLL